MSVNQRADAKKVRTRDDDMKHQRKAMRIASPEEEQAQAKAQESRKARIQQQDARLKAHRKQKKDAKRAAVDTEEAEGSGSESWESCSSDGNEFDVAERFDEMGADEVIEEAEESESGEEGEEGGEGGVDEGYEHFQKEAASLTKAMEKGANVEDEEEKPATVWRADKGDALQDGQELTYESRAYDSFFQLRTEYPALSFDVIRDNDGLARTKYPMSMYLVCGSQAENATKNNLYVLRVSNICKTKYDAEDSEEEVQSFIGSDESGSESGGEEPEDVNNGEPIVDYRTIPHMGCANRVRCDPHHASLVAVWSDAGRVQIFDVENECRSMGDFAQWSKEQALNWNKPAKTPLRFASSSTTHQVEGYAMDWSTLDPHVLATGDCYGHMYVWNPTDSGRWAPSCSSVQRGHSVEEIKWSPTQRNVFAACRAGGMVEIWDTRDMKRPRITWQADATDINVADWNKEKVASHLLVTGADSGMVSVWDLRNVGKGDTSSLQSLNFHKTKITSVEFSTFNESVVAVTSDDNQCTLWDLSLERDPEEEKTCIGDAFGRADVNHLPDQLMFQHQGLKSPKECHFHPQIPGMVITTDFMGLHLFKPMNWRSLMK